ncbi:hypothetical protein KDK77_08320 [bacterium]|nr:hypothetical protein [bacterium]MCP5461707.1 hypothetical protein [bacterium]
MKDDIYWQNDAIVVRKNDFHSNDNSLEKIEITEGKTVFQFKKGYATQ